MVNVVKKLLISIMIETDLEKNVKFVKAYLDPVFKYSRLKLV